MKLYLQYEYVHVCIYYTSIYTSNYKKTKPNLRRNSKQTKPNQKQNKTNKRTQFITTKAYLNQQNKKYFIFSQQNTTNEIT